MSQAGATTIRRRMIAAGGAGALLLPGTLVAQQAPVVPSITVEGQASGMVAPDTARLSVGVDAERPTASAAAAEVARAAQAVVAQIKAEGIDDKDVATGSIALVPVFSDEGGSAHTPRSYRASTDLGLTIRPPDRAGVVAAHLVDKGATTIEGVAFSSSEQAHVFDDLRTAAMRDAARKARIYVDALNLKLGRVLEITPMDESGPPVPTFTPARTSILAATPKIPLEPGVLTLYAGARVRWEIAP